MVENLPQIDFREPLTPAQLYGVVIPLVTPWECYKYPTVDKEALTKEVESVLPYADILFAAGNAGEGTLMDPHSWYETVGAVIEARNKSGKKVPVAAGILRNNYAETRSLSAQAQNLGANAIVIAPMCADEPKEILRGAVDGSNLPIILYNNPSMHGGKELPLEFMKWARDEFGYNRGLPHKIIGIKSSVKNNSNSFRQIMSLQTTDFKVFQGNTEDAATSLWLGTDGIIPVEACVYAEDFKNLYDNKCIDCSLFTNSMYRVNDILNEVKRRKSELKLGSAGVIKTMLVESGVFKSARMYVKPQ